MTLSAEKSGGSQSRFAAAKVGFDSSCGGRKVIKKMDLDPMGFISIFLPPLWLEWLEYFVSIFFSKHRSQQANPSFLESHLKRKQGDLSI